MSITTIIFGCVFIGSLIGIKVVDAYEKEFTEIDQLNNSKESKNKGEE